MKSINHIASKNRKSIALILLAVFSFSISSFAFNEPNKCSCMGNMANLERTAPESDSQFVCSCLVKVDPVKSTKIVLAQKQLPQKCNLKQTKNPLGQFIVTNKLHCRTYLETNNLALFSAFNSFNASLLFLNGAAVAYPNSPPAFISYGSLLI